jgi:hypothetical protein
MAALTQVTVVRDHRAAISNGRSLTMRLITELDVETSHLGEMKREIDAGPDSPSRRNAMLKAVSLPSRAAVMRDLAAACRAWVGLERQAFSIIEEKEPPPPPSEDVTAEQLRQEIIDQIEDLGIKLYPDDEPSGIANRGKTSH